ncbi:MAG: patatin [Arcobacter sp.]|uniref:patatin-like phospholipase family protein n=1 Tax=uncultured Arcobacter sp. TaxID=165434 RepID=UPI000CAA58FF|nr:patatin-like phospholipase family protein [uncultured Arcobacter sp.]PLY08797.1 MAG: patatin [Arcobacter sp.]
MDNLALCLSGGAARGAFHLGILAYLEDKTIEIKAYSGSSIGAIISCSHASGIEARKQLEIFKSDEIKKTLKFNYFKNGLLRIDKEHHLLDTILPIKNLEDIPKSVHVNAYDTKTKKIYYFNKGETHPLCLASSALIPIFKPIHYDHKYLIDGGLFDNMPISPLQNKDYKIVCIDLMPKSEKNQKKRFDLLKPLKKRLFQTRFNNGNYSIQHSDLYITHPLLRQTPMFTFKGLQDIFDLGYKEAPKFFS